MVTGGRGPSDPGARPREWPAGSLRRGSWRPRPSCPARRRAPRRSRGSVPRDRGPRTCARSRDRCREKRRTTSSRSSSGERRKTIPENQTEGIKTSADRTGSSSKIWLWSKRKKNEVGGGAGHTSQGSSNGWRRKNESSTSREAGDRTFV